jgi:hypothetical protein
MRTAASGTGIINDIAKSTSFYPNDTGDDLTFAMFGPGFGKMQTMADCSRRRPVWRWFHARVYR